MATANSYLFFSFLFLYFPQFHTYNFIFNGFRKASNMSFSGASIVTRTGALQLTNSSANLIGRAFYSSPIRLFNTQSRRPKLSSFSTTFLFAIVKPYEGSGGGGHGLVFTLSPSKEPRGSWFAQYYGLLGPTNDGNSTNHVFAIEFDTVYDIALFGDINDNHVGIDVNSFRSIASEPASYYLNGTTKKEMRLESGQPIQAWIDYNGENEVVNVTISPVSVPKPSQPLLSRKINLSDVLVESMYVGFSSSTGKLASSHYILGWSFSMNGVASPLDLRRLPFPPGNQSGASGLGNKAIIIGAISSVVTLLLLALAISTFMYLLRRAKQAEVLEDWELDCPHRFRYKDLYVATKGFKESHILGSGGFGWVYKGVLPNTKEEVAIKRVSHNSKQGVKEFVAEVASLGKLRHRHLVHLQGWCKRNADLLLVYDYMPNGSLETFLFDEEKDLVLNWPQRFKILQGIASALLYLHEEWEQVVVHRDVKANNILLDADMNGRLGDFGLAKLYEHGKNPSTTHVVGTVGYIAPELSRTGKATASSDVFAYGALLLEVTCGRRPIDPNAPSGNLLLLDWVRECRQRGQILEAVDPKMEDLYEKEEVEMVLILGLLCSQSTPEARPTIRQVTRYLNGTDILAKTDVPMEFTDTGSEDFCIRSYPSSFGVISTGSLTGGR
ncbi:hypothetical protein HHK36_018606 [Tetracentron sinense]|uniref:non-specific serine/threonine protein kinase n=1 Tax=Tetracentron sinense TaxID=13715 RepID=A0A834Y879_TETSI|nr:hypothetical protein HHK36_032376 [Tetracentron sinense]KAF8396969.1 hypothetical protein HHK36_018606 [Tetracentron sinense]